MEQIDVLSSALSSPEEVIDRLTRLSFVLQGISEVLALMDGNRTPNTNIPALLQADTARISDQVWQYCEILLRMLKTKELSS